MHFEHLPLWSWIICVMIVGGTLFWTQSVGYRQEKNLMPKTGELAWLFFFLFISHIVGIFGSLTPFTNAYWGEDDDWAPVIIIVTILTHLFAFFFGILRTGEGTIKRYTRI